MVFSEYRPIYEQIKDDIEKKINNKIYKKGKRLPSERELAKEYGVTRVTIRQSIAGLVHMNLVEKIAGTGTFVKGKKHQQRIDSWKGVVVEMSEQQKNVKVDILKVEFIKYKESMHSIWKSLDRPISEKIYMFTRRIYVDDEPLLIDENFFPEHIGEKFENLDISKVMVYQGLSTLGYNIFKAEQNINASVAMSESAKRLETPIGSPILNVERTVYSDKDEIIVFTKAMFVGEKYSYHVTLNSNEGNTDNTIQ